MKSKQPTQPEQTQTPAQRKAAQRARFKELGLVEFSVVVPNDPEAKAKLRAYCAKLAKQYTPTQAEHATKPRKAPKPKAATQPKPPKSTTNKRGTRTPHTGKGRVLNRMNTNANEGRELLEKLRVDIEAVFTLAEDIGYQLYFSDYKIFAVELFQLEDETEKGFVATATMDRTRNAIATLCKQYMDDINNKGQHPGHNSN